MGGGDAGIIAEIIFLTAAFVAAAAAAVGMGDTREALFEDAIVARRWWWGDDVYGGGRWAAVIVMAQFNIIVSVHYVLLDVFGWDGGEHAERNAHGGNHRGAEVEEEDEEITDFEN